VAVPAGLHLWPSLQRIEASLADLVEACSGIYVAQSEIDMIRLARDEADSVAPDVLEKIRAYVRPRLTTMEFVQWMRRYAVTYIDAPSWIDSMRKFDFVVGPRFHGVMLGVQAGIPGGVIAHDSRTLELCNTMGLPVCLHHALDHKFTIQDLKTIFKCDWVAYDERRRDLARTLTHLFSAANLSEMPQLKTLIEDGSPESNAA